MTRETIIAAALSFGLAVTASAQTTKDELVTLEQRIAQAWMDGDRETLDGIIANDWRVIDVVGRVRTKAQVFDDMLSPGAPVVAEMVIDEVEVLLLDGCAVITGRTRAMGADGTTVLLRFTDVAVRRDGRWQVVASQGTPIAE